jgi:DNA-binding GntR family transcriptional regulator
MRLGVFRALDDLGLVEIHRNRGACVRKIDLDEATESLMHALHWRNSRLVVRLAGPFGSADPSF